MPFRTWAKVKNASQATKAAMKDANERGMSGPGGYDDRRKRQKATNMSQEDMVKGDEHVNDDERGTMRRDFTRGQGASTPINGILVKLLLSRKPC